MVLGACLMTTPADEQSVVGPVFERSRPRCGSLAVAGTPLSPPLSGSPMPPSHADVTMLLPAGPPHSAAVPTNTNGTACSGGAAVAAHIVPKTSVDAIATTCFNLLTRMSSLLFGVNQRVVRNRARRSGYDWLVVPPLLQLAATGCRCRCEPDESDGSEPERSRQSSVGWILRRCEYADRPRPTDGVRVPSTLRGDAWRFLAPRMPRRRSRAPRASAALARPMCHASTDG